MPKLFNVILTIHKYIFTNDLSVCVFIEYEKLKNEIFF